MSVCVCVSVCVIEKERGGVKGEVRRAGCKGHPGTQDLLCLMMHAIAASRLGLRNMIKRIKTRRPTVAE